MKINVPFLRQTTPLNCGPIALKIVFSYFKKDFPIELIEEKSELKKGKGISTLKLAKACLDLGFNIKIFSRYIDIEPPKDSIESDFHKKYGEENLIEMSKIRIKELREKGVEMHELSVPLEQLLSYLTKKSIPIVLIDWNIVSNRQEKGYQGHFVVLVGYDEENVYIHEPGQEKGAFFPIKKDIFDKARKAKGTDEDILMIFG